MPYNLGVGHKVYVNAMQIKDLLRIKLFTHETRWIYIDIICSCPQEKIHVNVLSVLKAGLVFDSSGCLS